MLRTLSGWIGNALDELNQVWGEPLTWLIVVAAVGYGLWLWRQGHGPSVASAATYLVATGWLIGTLAITIYPIQASFDPPPWERLEIESVVPFAGTIQSLGHMRDRIMTAEEHAAMTVQIAEASGMAPEDVNLGWVIQGTDPAGVLRDPVGNLLLFLPLGLLAPLLRRGTSWKRVAVVAAAVSGGIEASQLLFGLGSLASIDDVIFNTAGALVGFAANRLLKLSGGRLLSQYRGRPGPAQQAATT